MVVWYKWQVGAMKLHSQKAEVESLRGYSKQEISELQEQIYKSYDDQLKRITEMVNSEVFLCSLFVFFKNQVLFHF